MKTKTAEVQWSYYGNGQLEVEQFYVNDRRHNPNGPAYSSWYSNGQLQYEADWNNNVRHNLNGSSRRWYMNGQLQKEEYWIDGKQLTKEEFENRNIDEDDRYPGKKDFLFLCDNCCCCYNTPVVMYIRGQQVEFYTLTGALEAYCLETEYDLEDLVIELLEDFPFNGDLIKLLNELVIINKLQSCNGKVIEIDGKKYKLQEV